MDQSAIQKPLDCQFKIFCPGALSHLSVDIFFIFFCQLHRNGIPHQVQSGNQRILRMLGKILAVIIQQIFLNFSDPPEIFIIHIGLDHFRHTTDIIVLSQTILVFGSEGIDHLRIPGLQKLCKSFFSQGAQKFLEIERIQIHEVYLAYRERGALVHRHTQQGTGSYNGIFRSIFAKIL